MKMMLVLLPVPDLPTARKVSCHVHLLSSGHTLKPVQHTSKHVALLILVSGCETAYAHLHHISAKHFHAADLGHEKFYFASFLGINFQENKLRQVEEALSVLNRYT